MTVSDIHVGRDWLRQMGDGARKNGMTIQYCMAEFRHLMQSLEIPVVTQVSTIVLCGTLLYCMVSM